MTQQPIFTQKAFETSDELFNRLMNQSVRVRAEVTTEFHTLIDKLDKGLLDFERMLNQPFKGGKTNIDRIDRALPDFAKVDEVYEVENMAGEGKVILQTRTQYREMLHDYKAVLKSLSEGFRKFARETVVGEIIFELFMQILEETHNLWRFSYKQEPLRPEDFTRGRCKKRVLVPDGGIWKASEIKELIRACDDYNTRTVQIWDEIVSSWSISVVNFELKNLRPEYLDFSSRMTRDILSRIQDSRFKERDNKRVKGTKTWKRINAGPK